MKKIELARPLDITPRRAGIKSKIRGVKTETQLQWTREKLNTYGQVSRNEALRNYITRLGARINDLKNEGLEIEGHFEKTDHGKDYIYQVKPRGQLTLI